MVTGTDAGSPVYPTPSSASPRTRDGPHDSSEHRCQNAGWGAEIHLDLFDPDRRFLDAKAMTLEAWGNDQLNRVFEAHPPVIGHVEVRSVHQCQVRPSILSRLHPRTTNPSLASTSPMRRRSRSASC